jgi:hypothetical protein
MAGLLAQLASDIATPAPGFLANNGGDGARRSVVEIAGKVWIVQHDEGPDNTVLGVFLGESEAAAFAEEVKNQFANGVIYSCFEVGYRLDQNSRRYRAPDVNHPGRHDRGAEG